VRALHEALGAAQNSAIMIGFSNMSELLARRRAPHAVPSVEGSVAKTHVTAVAALLLACAVCPADGWKNGRAETPPLGFSTWNWKQTCTTSDMLKPVVEAMVGRGLVKAGCVRLHSRLVVALALLLCCDVMHFLVAEPLRPLIARSAHTHMLCFVFPIIFHFGIFGLVVEWCAELGAVAVCAAPAVLAESSLQL
jgi:hypothetical protein